MKRHEAFNRTHLHDWQIIVEPKAAKIRPDVICVMTGVNKTKYGCEIENACLHGITGFKLTGILARSFQDTFRGDTAPQFGIDLRSMRLMMSYSNNVAEVIRAVC